MEGIPALDGVHVRSSERLEAVLSRTIPRPARLEIGAMVETPAAVFAIDDIAPCVDFLSIGTNDLTQFTLAADRLRTEDDDCTVLHPAMLKALDQVVRAAQACGRPVAVCGEAAGDPATACLLVGLGIRELSMSPARAARIRFALCSIRAEDARALADRALRAAGPREVRSALDAFHFARPGEEAASAPGGRSVEGG